MLDVKWEVILTLGNQNDRLPKGISDSWHVEHVRIATGAVGEEHLCTGTTVLAETIIVENQSIS